MILLSPGLRLIIHKPGIHNKVPDAQTHNPMPSDGAPIDILRDYAVIAGSDIHALPPALLGSVQLGRWMTQSKLLCDRKGKSSTLGDEVDPQYGLLYFRDFKSLCGLHQLKLCAPVSILGEHSSYYLHLLTMADSKDLVSTVWGPEFTEGLLPASQQVSLLYHLSYLCLAKFPKLERLLRMRCVETQMLFGTSEAVLLKCVGTSNNLVTSLFPILIKTIEGNKPAVAVKYLEKAKAWITEIIQDVSRMVEKYEALNQNVATTTSDVNTEKKETEAALEKLKKEQQALMDAIKELEGTMKSSTAKIEELKKEIDAKNAELQNAVKEMAAKCQKFSIVAACVPFIGAIIKAAEESKFVPEGTANIKKLEADVNRLYDSKNLERQKEWTMQIQLIDKRMELTKLQIQLGIIPEPTYLNDVQLYLSKIQQILIELKGFWEKVRSLLDVIKQKTFVNEDLIDEPDFKDEFVKSIQNACGIWGSFGDSCNKAVVIFKIQSKDAYKFLEIDPSTLSPDVWQKQYDSVKKQLEDLKVGRTSAAPPIKN
ncbi:epidermal growth factor receptor substrate 15-like [Hoplias malabaricus]|uniref:epidermal growth factor receptor substrate 15-like n=1 Tax=Hoplias malabaricus TaxID=27720 RepID=UPI003462789D